jgi:hypothetical protein
MGYYVTNTFSIGWSSKYDTREKVSNAVNRIIEDSYYSDAKDAVCLDSQLSDELVARKGGVFVIAGTFNYWNYGVFDFARKISEQLDTDVSVMKWDHEEDYIECRAYKSGRDINEQPPDASHARKLIQHKDCKRILGGLNNDEEILVTAYPDAIVSDPYDPKLEHSELNRQIFYKKQTFVRTELFDY